jgi:hypothetical protein
LFYFSKNDNDRNTLARPFLQLLRLLKGDDSINFIDNIVDVEAYDVNMKLYREKKHNFIVTPIEKGIVNVVGKLNSDKKIVDLTEDEIIIAKNIGFVPIVNENKNKEFDYLLNLEHFSTGINSTSPHKSYRIGYSGGMFEVICDFFKNGEIVEQKSVQSPNKTYWASAEDGIIRISYSFYMPNGVYEQID